jgi:hypothetical protein
MSESIDEDLVIKDIDSPLYKYFYFYRIDIKNYFASDRQKLVQKIISNILSIYLLICVIRYGIIAVLIKKRKFSLYYFDLFQYFGEFPEFYYTFLIFCSIFCFRILHIFNHSNINDYVWIKIIRALNGSQSFDSLKIYKKNEIQKYVQKIRTFKFLINLYVYSTLTFALFTSLTILFLFFNYSDLIRFGLLSAFIFLIDSYFWLSIIGFSFLYYFIVCFYCKTIFKSFNNSIKLLFDGKGKAFLKYKTIDQLIKDHNSICLDIKLCNKFWQKYYFSLTYTLIPTNLILLQLILFEDQILPVFFVCLFCFLYTIGSHLMFNLMTASINSEASKSYKSLLEMYLKTNSLLNTKRKMKVILNQTFYRFFKLE